jgi:hypothetical protein
VRSFGALARHTTALAAERGVPATRAGMTVERWGYEDRGHACSRPRR